MIAPRLREDRGDPTPIIEISALPQKPGTDRRTAIKRLCTELARATGAAEHAFWATWTELPPGDYTEGANAPAVQPDATHPPLVRLFAFEGRSDKDIERLLELTAAVLVRELRLGPGNVFVRYEQGTAGRAYSGGAVMRKKPATARKGQGAPKARSKKK